MKISQVKKPLVSSLLLIAIILLGSVGIGEWNFADELPRLKVSDNRRILVTDDGKPFFWLGDTAWELFHRLNREEAIKYLDHRAANGFNVVQAVALAEVGGLSDPNPYGHKPLVDNDPERPDVHPGDDDDYWDHVDFVVKEANRRGIYVGLLPTWGDKWNKKWGQGPEIFDPENAKIYGRWIANRYKDRGVVWILGGDRPIESDLHKTIIQSMAQGIREGSGGKQLITWHPMGGSGSSQYFHDEPWLDFNMRQNGHSPEFTSGYDSTRLDYERNPIKPVIDGEAIYEDHPISFDANRFGHSIASDVRRPVYWNLFNGAFGQTYGHHSVWQMWREGREPVNNPLMPWTEALNQPGALQMKHARSLIESRPFLGRIPDPKILVADRVPTSVPGSGRYRFVATRDEAGTYAMVYAPIGRSFRVNTTVIQGAQIRAWWFNPRNGQASLLGEFPNERERQFTPPEPGESLDWVLVLDDASKGYSAPGKR